MAIFQIFPWQMFKTCKANYYYRTGLTSIPTDAWFLKGRCSARFLRLRLEDLPYSTVDSTNTHSTINFDSTALSASGPQLGRMVMMVLVAVVFLIVFLLWWCS